MPADSQAQAGGSAAPLRRDRRLTRPSGTNPGCTALATALVTACGQRRALAPGGEGKGCLRYSEYQVTRPASYIAIKSQLCGSPGLRPSLRPASALRVACSIAATSPCASASIAYDPRRRPGYETLIARNSGDQRSDTSMCGSRRSLGDWECPGTLLGGGGVELGRQFGRCPCAVFRVDSLRPGPARGPGSGGVRARLAGALCPPRAPPGAPARPPGSRPWRASASRSAGRARRSGRSHTRCRPARTGPCLRRCCQQGRR